MRRTDQVEWGGRSRRARLAGAWTGVAGIVLGVLLAAAQPAQATSHPHVGRIAFVADTDTGAQLFTVGANGRDLRQISDLDGEAVAPDWSPDGRSIVFEHDLPGDEGARIEVVRPDGSHRATLVQDAGVFDGEPSYTPDGSHIVFVRFDPASGANDIWSMDLTRGRQRRITAGPGFGVGAPKVSPNGHTLSFVAGGDGAVGFGLYVCALDGSHLRPVVPVRTDLVNKQDWALRRRLLASSDHHDHLTPDVSENLFTVRPDGRHLTYLTHFTGGSQNAVMGSFSPDGHALAFRLEDHGRYGIYRIPADGGTSRPMLPLSDLKPRYIDWGPPPARRAQRLDRPASDPRTMLTMSVAEEHRP